jgi:hypothetical protein
MQKRSGVKAVRNKDRVFGVVQLARDHLFFFGFAEGLQSGLSLSE